MRKKKADRYILSDRSRYRNTKTTALPKELLQLKSISSSSTRIRALILGRGIKYMLKKTLAEFEADQSATRKVLPDGRKNRSTIVENFEKKTVALYERLYEQEAHCSHTEEQHKDTTRRTVWSATSRPKIRISTYFYRKILPEH